MHTMEYYPALKTEILQYVTIWIKSEDMLSKISQSQKEKYYYIIPLICRIYNKIVKFIDKNGGYQGLGESRKWETADQQA